MSILITYALAGSEAYAQLMHTRFEFLIVPFVTIFTGVIVLGSKGLHAVLSLFTFFKGAILVLMVAITAIAAAHVQRSATNDWKYMGQSFLIGTVALGGAVNILPVIFARVRMQRKDIIKFNSAILLALFTVWVMNVLWCYYVSTSVTAF